MGRMSRRGFLRHLALGGSAKSGKPAGNVLVCVFLRGGADTLNMVVPYGDDRYYALRPTLSIAPPSKSSKNAEASLALDDFYAFHPRLSPLLPLFKDGRLGIVQAVGSDNPTGSHFEAQDQMEHGEAYGRTIGGGWLGRHLRQAARQTSPLSAVALGATIPESLRGAPAASALSSLDDIRIETPSGDTTAVCRALARLYGAETGVLSQAGESSLDLLARVEKLRDSSYKAEDGASYPEGSFGDGLREIARLIKAGVGLEIACIDLGGWDTHFIQGTATGLQAESIDLLARGLAAFDADLKDFHDRVTTCVMTEFGRRIYQNGSLGTDHGRGFAFMAIGNRINGGKIHGKWPGLDEQEMDLLGPTGLKILIDYRSIFCEVLSGVLGNSAISKIFAGFAPEPIGLVDMSKKKPLESL